MDSTSLLEAEDSAAATGSAALSIQMVDHHDAIRARDPLTRLGGLALDFVGNAVPAPMALCLVAGESRTRTLLEIKVDPALTDEPEALRRDCLKAIESSTGMGELLPGPGRYLVLDRDTLGRDTGFEEKDFASRFMAEWGLESILTLIMQPKASGAVCVVTLLRPSGQGDFSDREKRFLRQMAPLLSQSVECALDTGTGRPGPGPRRGGRRTDDVHKVLTKRELEIARLAAGGAANEEIAAELNITVGTVKCHMRNIYSKLGINSRVRLSLLYGAA